MELRNGKWRLAATDVPRHLACPHLTTLAVEVARGLNRRPAQVDPRLDLLIQRGRDHERAYVDQLVRDGRHIVDLSDGPTSPFGSRGRVRWQEEMAAQSSSWGGTGEPTLKAMEAGADVIVQGDLGSDAWSARPDLLLRVETPSRFGAWSYEVADTKLARETKASAVLQLCTYSQRLAEIQGCEPERMHVVRPGNPFVVDSLRIADFGAYYRFVRNVVLETVNGVRPAGTYPERVPQCDTCEWWTHCDSRRRSDDHLSLVAGIRRTQIDRLRKSGITTLSELGRAEDSALPRPNIGTLDSLRRVRDQARVQLRGRDLAAPVHETLAPEWGKGLLRLPTPSLGDVFLDFEGDPFMDGGGLEYLLGYAYWGSPQGVANPLPVGLDGFSSQLRYVGLWGLDRPAEKRAFEDFIDFVLGRWADHPDMHIYHFGVYERTALQSLVGRHATREQELDAIFRGGRLVDLHSITRQSIRASVEKYSLKDLEPFCGFSRETDLRSASAALREVERSLELGLPQNDLTGALETVESYNREDCLATAALQAWLESVRQAVIQGGTDLPRPTAPQEEPTRGVTERANAIEAVRQALLAKVPLDRNCWSPEDGAKWLLAQLVAYFHREEKCAWWDYFRIRDLEYEELLEERKAIVGLEFVGRAACGSPRDTWHEYRFPPQEVSMREGDRLEEIRGPQVGKLVEVQPVAGRLVVEKTKACSGYHPASLQTLDVVPPRPLEPSLLALARDVAEQGFAAGTRFTAGRDLLLRNRPRLRRTAECAPVDSPLLGCDEGTLAGAVRLARSLDGGVLPVQGPPGTGKTYTAARMIVVLAKDHSIGITAVSHKVIRNLLHEVRSAALEASLDLRIVQKGDPEEQHPEWLEVTEDNGEALGAIRAGAVVGGTAWLWSRNDAVDRLEYLFVDEAGQMSLAHVLAASRCARNLILLGDPQQLQQPQRGAHPEGAEASALSHLLDGAKTLPPDRGVFIPTTWRLPPSICRFTSELYYEGRLESHAGLDRQAILIRRPYDVELALPSNGLVYFSVPHEGNQSRSLEEVEAVAQVVDLLTQSGVKWRGRDVVRGSDLKPRRIELADILVVAPYNAQVGALLERLPNGARVGTVDRFQGQEAPIVIYSMASSSAADAPRGTEFLFDPNRMNVATSRARGLCIVVGSPGVLEVECRTLEQMRRTNGLCRFVEMARAQSAQPERHEEDATECE